MTYQPGFGDASKLDVYDMLVAIRYTHVQDALIFASPVYTCNDTFYILYPNPQLPALQKIVLVP